MKKQEKNINEKNLKKGGNSMLKIGLWLEKNVNFVAMAIIFVVMASSVTFAGAADAESMWNAVMELIETWIIRLGLVVLLVGGVMFGLGFKNDDAEQKTRGVNTMISGGIVTAVAGLVSYLIV